MVFSKFPLALSQPENVESWLGGRSLNLSSNRIEINHYGFENNTKVRCNVKSGGF
jgi:hypothetical protein